MSVKRTEEISVDTHHSAPCLHRGIEVALCTRDGECLGPLADVPSQTCQACPSVQVRTKLRRLQLDNNGVYKREQAREASPGYPNAPWFIRLAYFM